MPVLIALAEAGSMQAMDDLQAIGTPQAVEELVPLLWDSDQTLAEKAAWRLAAMLPKPNIETVLRDYPLTETQRKSKWLDWIWEPFDGGDKYNSFGSRWPEVKMMKIAGHWFLR